MSGANERNGLSPSARALLDAARGSDQPTKADRERVRRAVGVALAAGAGTAGTVSAATGVKALASTATGAAGTGAGLGATVGGGAAASTGLASAATASLFTKVAIAVVALGVGSGAIVAVHHYAGTPGTTTQATDDATTLVVETEAPAPVSARPTSASPVPTDRASDAVVAVAEPAVAEPAVAEPAVAEPVPVAGTETAPRVETTVQLTPAAEIRARAPRHVRASPTTTTSSDDEDVSIDLERAVLLGALGHASPERRLASVEAHNEQFPLGQLSGGREFARRRAVHDLCAEGTQAVAHYLAAHPTSSSAPLIQRTCPER